MPTANAASRRHHQGKVLLTVLIAVVAVVLAGGTWLLTQPSSGSEEAMQRDLVSVRRGSFDVVIPSNGELAALNQLEVVNQLEIKAVLTELIPEGVTVKPGDVLFRIADEDLRDRIKNAEDAHKTAEANLAAATSSLAVKRSSAESDLAKADLNIELAKLALDAWDKGEVVAKRNDLALALETAEINHERLEEKFEESERLLSEGHISKDEREQDRIAMIEASARVKTATLEIEVYELYQYHQDRAKKNSDLEQAIAERDRVIERNNAEINNATIALSSSEYKLQTAEERLVRLREQLEYCEIRAPSGGLVVYATSLDSDRRRGQNDRTLQIGTELRPNETVIVLPDTSQMIANVKVNEALTGRIEEGQYVNVVSDALPNVPISGEVLSVGVLAEGGGWRDPNRRDYTVKVLLDAGEELGLKPSMRCKAEIVVEEVTDSLYVPVAAVFRKGRMAFVYVADATGFAEREVRVGRSSELEVEVIAGLEEGEMVLMREPSKEEVVTRLEDEEAGGEAPHREAAGRGSRPATVATG